MVTIGQRIKARREELGLTQGELAQKLGYKSKSTVNKIELGINQITQDKINRFAKALDCSVSYLMGLDEPSASHKEKLYNNIKKYRQRSGMTQDELAQKLGYADKSMISRIENGKIDLAQSQIQKFADVFNISVSTLMGDNTYGGFSISHDGKKKIPILGHVAAGVPIEMLDNVIGYTLYDDDPDGDYFGLVVRGDSMEPRMFSGDIVVVKKQPDIESGQIAVVAVNGNEATCKRVMKSEDGITLVSLNSKYMPKFYTNREVREKPVTIIGKVVQVTGKIN